MTLAEALNADHYEEIVVSSAVDPAVAAARGYRTLTGTAAERAELAEIGYHRRLAENDETYPALLVPMHGADGGVGGFQLKPATPRTRTKSDGTRVPVKYESPKGASAMVDVPARTREHLANTNEALWITEGMKKVDALVSAGLCALGLTGVFNWRNSLGTLPDWEDIPIKNRPMVICFDADAASNRNVQLAMTRLGNWLKKKGADSVHYLIVPPKVDERDVKGVDDFFAAGGTLETLAAAATTTPPGGGPQDASFADAYLVEEVGSGALDNRFCWVSGLGWMKWDGGVWAEVADTEPVEAVRLWALAQFENTIAEQRKDSSRDLASQIQGWRGVLQKNRLRALVDLARGLSGVQRYVEDFDADPDLLTVRNGTVHLPTGKLLAADPGHFITRMAGASYVPGAQHRLWSIALQALPRELHEWFQDRMGQAVTGYKTPDHVLVISHGTGSNGKTVVTTMIRDTIGKYGVVISDRVLMASPDAHPTELMDLRGARYAVLEETPEARHLNVQRLKTTLGSSSIVARRIRQDPVEFPVTHSLFINTNYRPVVNETDHGTWRRLALATYPYTFRARQADVKSPSDRWGNPDLEYAAGDPLVRTAVLAWLVEGAKAWYARDRRMLPMPDAVIEDTREWRAETDLVMGFTTECLTLSPEEFTPTPKVLTAFNEWVTDRGHRPWNDKTFGARFSGHDMIRGAKVSQGRKYVGGKQVRGWHGVALGTPGGDADPFDDGPAPEPPADPYPRPDDSPGPCCGNAPCTCQNAPIDPVAQAAVDAVGVDLETASADQLYMGGYEGPFVRLGGLRLPYGDVTEPADQYLPQPFKTLNGALSEAREVYGHNVLGFDLQALAHHTGADFDALAARAWDTQVAEELLDPPLSKGMPTGYYRLDTIAKRYGHAGKTDDVKALAERHGGFDQIPLNDRDYNLYLLGDLAATEHVYKAQMERFAAEPGRLAYARREMRVMSLFHRMSLNGWAVDAPLLTERVAHENAQREDAKAALHAEFGMPTHRPDRVKMKRKSDWPERYQRMAVKDIRAVSSGDELVSMGVAERIPGAEYISPWATSEGRDALVKAFQDAGAQHYPKTANGDLKLSSEALGEERWYDADAKKSRPGMLQVYRDNAAVRRLCGLITQATGATAKYAEIAKFVAPDGRVHAEIGPAQGSGRRAMRKPSLTNMGKRGGRVTQRAVMVADAGHVHLTCDLSQVDMRALAGLSQDPAYMRLFEPGRDAHMEMAEVYFGERTKGARDKTKAFNHAGNYGQGDRAVAERTGLALEVCQRISAAKREAYPRLAEWIEETRDLGASGVLLDNGFGRLMRCDPERAYTQAPALMGQGAARDLMAEGLLRLVDHAADKGLDVRPALRGVVHDEVVLSVPGEEAEVWQQVLHEAFTFEWRGVPILCEVGAPGRSWADAYAGE